MSATSKPRKFFQLQQGVLGDAAGRLDEAGVALKQGGVSEADAVIQAWLDRRDPTCPQSLSTPRVGPPPATPFGSTNSVGGDGRMDEGGGHSPHREGLGPRPAKESDPAYNCTHALSPVPEPAKRSKPSSAAMQPNPDVGADVNVGDSARVEKVSGRTADSQFEAGPPTGTNGYMDACSSSGSMFKKSLDGERQEEGKEMPVQQYKKEIWPVEQYEGEEMTVRRYTRAELLAARHVEAHPQWPGWGPVRELRLSREPSPVGSGNRAPKSGKPRHSAPPRHPVDSAT